jgi:hypothetical protein
MEARLTLGSGVMHVIPFPVIPRDAELSPLPLRIAALPTPTVRAYRGEEPLTDALPLRTYEPDKFSQSPSPVLKFAKRPRVFDLYIHPETRHPLRWDIIGFDFTQ